MQFQTTMLDLAADLARSASLAHGVSLPAHLRMHTPVAALRVRTCA